MYKFKVILAGDKNVGKSSLITRYCDNSFDEHMKETIGVAFKRKKVILIDNDREFALGLNIWDFGGQEQFKKLFPYYIKGVSGAFMVFELANLQSLINLDWWWERLEEYKWQFIFYSNLEKYFNKNKSKEKIYLNEFSKLFQMPKKEKISMQKSIADTYS